MDMHIPESQGMTFELNYGYGKVLGTLKIGDEEIEVWVASVSGKMTEKPCLPPGNRKYVPMRKFKVVELLKV